MNVATMMGMRGLADEQVVLEGSRISGRINDLMAEVTLEQRYRNDGEANIEAVYTFPIPLDAVLLGLEVELGGRWLSGVVVAKGQAEHRYEEAVTDGDSAVLLEEAGPGLYTASVGNLMAGERARARVRYGLLLGWNGERVRLHIPTTISHRYGSALLAGMAPHQVPETSLTASHSLEFELVVTGRLASARFHSPTHALAVQAASGDVRLELDGKVVLDRDIVIDMQAAASGEASALLAPDGDGWVALASFRPQLQDPQRSAPRAIKVVVDCSGSMAGDSMKQAKEALERIVRGLRPQDAFEIIAFGSDARPLFGRCAPVTPASVKQALRFVASLDADLGGTETGQALHRAYASGCERGLQKDVLLITDGAIWNEAPVVNAAVASGHRVFTVGVGSAVAEGVVRGVAARTGGACEMVSPREDMAGRIERQFQRMFALRVERVQLRWPGAVTATQPQVPGPVFDGDTLHAFAWFSQAPAGEVMLDVGDDRSFEGCHRAPLVRLPVLIDQVDGPATTLARLAAAQRVAAETDEAAATELAVRYQLITRWTSCVLVHERAAGEQATSLPELVKIRSMHAAGSHGLGSVLLRSMQESRIALSMDIPADADVDMDASDAFSAQEPVPSPDPLMMHASVPPAVERIADLEAWGASKELIDAMQALVELGHDEVAVIAAFVSLLLDAGHHDRVPRSWMRRALHQAKRQPDVALLKRVFAPAFQRWVTAA